jgi:SH3-like domain-containing protein
MKRAIFMIATVAIVVPGAVVPGSVMAGERYAVAGDRANIRSGPGIKYEILVEAEKNYPIMMLKKSGNWAQVKDFEGDTGWIHRSLIKKISSVITIKSKCNIRSGPGRTYDVVLISDQGVPFRVIKRKAKWIHVRHSEGHEGWIHQSLVW